MYGFGATSFRMVNQHDGEWVSASVHVWEYESVYYSCIGIILLFIFPFSFDRSLWYAWTLELDQNRFSLSLATFTAENIFFSSRVPLSLSLVLFGIRLWLYYA